MESKNDDKKPPYASSNKASEHYKQNRETFPVDSLSHLLFFTKTLGSIWMDLHILVLIARWFKRNCLVESFMKDVKQSSHVVEDVMLI